MKIDRRLVEALDDLLVRAFAEDGEDVTTLAVFGPKARVEADMVCRDAAVVAGVAFLPRVFAFLHPPARVELRVEDGTKVAPGTVLARVEGPAISVLAAERTALNLVQRLTGVATATQVPKRPKRAEAAEGPIFRPVAGVKPWLRICGCIGRCRAPHRSRPETCPR